jgi:hypothetical protein
MSIHGSDNMAQLDKGKGAVHFRIATTTERSLSDAVCLLEMMGYTADRAPQVGDLVPSVMVGGSPNKYPAAEIARFLGTVEMMDTKPLPSEKRPIWRFDAPLARCTWRVADGGHALSEGTIARVHILWINRPVQCGRQELPHE